MVLDLDKKRFAAGLLWSDKPTGFVHMRRKDTTLSNHWVPNTY